MFVRTLLTGATTVVGLWLIGRLFAPLLKKLEISRIEKAAVSLGLGAAACSYVLLLLGAFGLYRKLPVALAFGALSLAGAFVGLLTGRTAPSTDRSASRLTPVQWALAAIVAIGLARAFLASLCPEYQPDALMYHLYLPVMYLSKGSVAFDVHNFTSGYGLLPEFTFGVPAALGEVEGARIVHVAFFAASLAFIYGWARSAWGRTPALFAAAMLAAPHMMGWCAHTANTEYFMTLFVLASLRLLLTVPARPLVAGALAGFAWASKPVALGFAALVFASYAISDLKAMRRIVKYGALFAAGCAAAYLPWSVRSYIGTGNPLYPFLCGVLCSSAELASTLKDITASLKESWGVMRNPIMLLLLPLLLLLRPMRFGGLDAGFGWLFGYAALFLAPRFEDKRSLLVFIAGSALLFFISSHQLRFLMPAYFALALVSAAAYQRLARKSTAALVLLIFPIVNFLPVANWLGNRWLLTYSVGTDYLLGRETKAEFLARKSFGQIYQIKVVADLIDPSRSWPIAMFGNSEHLYFWPRRVVSFPLSPYAWELWKLILDGRADEAVARLKADGYRFLVTDSIFSDLLKQQVESGKLTPVFNTGTLTLMLTEPAAIDDIPYPGGFVPLQNTYHGKPKYYLWSFADGRFIARGIRRAKLELMIPSKALKERRPQTLTVSIDSSAQTFEFPAAGSHEVSFKLDACDGKPHPVLLKWAGAFELLKTGPLPIMVSAAVKGIELEMCDGSAFRPEKEYWPISGFKDWRALVNAD